ncbi:MAG TPA: FxLYD domain-containing protein [Thermoanaerobaculia bacterium]|nr:FxLYD domain-containing protein [Thermoanaerobaculia bacterium]
MRSRNGLVGAGLLLALAGTAPASGDWLVTKRGERIETAGAWEVRGRQVVFTQTNGTLASMRLSEVDLEASRSETERAKSPPPPAPAPPPKKAVMVLTDADVKKAEPPAAPADGAAEAAEAAPAGTVTEDLEVVTWQEIEGTGELDLQLMGEVRNKSSDVISDVKLTVRLLDAEGRVLATTQALIPNDSLGPGKSTQFRALFANLYAYDSVAFEARGGERFRAAVPEPEPEEEAES